MICVVLFDRDGTLIADVPNVCDPAQFIAMPGAPEAIALLRSRDMRIGVVTNQPRIGHGTLSRESLAAHNAHIESLVGVIDEWFICPHREDEGCACRKPAPGLIVQAAERFGVETSRCVVIGDIGADVEAARRAGARSVLVPGAWTRAEEILVAPVITWNILDAVEGILNGAAA